jgi:hypothetical protein
MGTMESALLKEPMIESEEPTGVVAPLSEIEAKSTSATTLFFI